MLGYVRRIVPFSSVDGPGNRTAVFMQGCNFRCFYCHNPETQQVGDGSIPLEGVMAMDHREVVTAVLKYRDFTQGVTLSGGECTVQLDFLLALCKDLQASNIEVFVDTNGHLAPRDFRQLCPYVDKFIFDVKATRIAEHTALTGHSPELVLENLAWAIAGKQLYEVRTVVVPDVLPNRVTVADTSRLISVDAAIRYKLIKFRARGVGPRFGALRTPDDQYMAGLQALALSLGVAKCIIV